MAIISEELDRIFYRFGIRVYDKEHRTAIAGRTVHLHGLDDVLGVYLKLGIIEWDERLGEYIYTEKADQYWRMLAL
jgi:hypothetical protein